MSGRATGRALALGLGILPLAASGAMASGFALKEQSGAALGNAFAGATAGAEDITYMFFNPAGLTRHEGNQVAAVASAIFAQSDFSNGAASNQGGAPITGGDGGGPFTPVVVPALYGLWSIDEDLKFGVGVNAPFGLKTEYDNGWIGRYHAIESELQTVNVNPAVAYEIVDGISLGAGLQVEYATATLSQAIDFGSLGPIGGAVPDPAQDGFAEVEGDDFGFGWNVGLLLEPIEGTRVGLAYRSMIAHTLEGDADFDLGTGGDGAIISGALGNFVDTGAQASVKTPESISAGIYHDIDDRWAVMAETSWTRWSRFQELRVSFDNPNQDDSVVTEDWDDSWFFAGGVTYRPAENWTLRLGVAHDQSPVPDGTRTPRVPDSDRTWIALGGQYAVGDWLTLDLGYTHIFVEDSSIALSSATPENQFRGNLSGDYDSAIDIVTIQGVVKF